MVSRPPGIAGAAWSVMSRIPVRPVMNRPDPSPIRRAGTRIIVTIATPARVQERDVPCAMETLWSHIPIPTRPGGWASTATTVMRVRRRAGSAGSVTAGPTWVPIPILTRSGGWASTATTVTRVLRRVSSAGTVTAGATWGPIPIRIPPDGGIATAFRATSILRHKTTVQPVMRGATVCRCMSPPGLRFTSRLAAAVPTATSRRTGLTS
jgi:hypothetical protein